MNPSLFNTFKALSSLSLHKLIRSKICSCERFSPPQPQNCKNSVLGGLIFGKMFIHAAINASLWSMAFSSHKKTSIFPQIRVKYPSVVIFTLSWAHRRVRASTKFAEGGHEHAWRNLRRHVFPVSCERKTELWVNDCVNPVQRTKHKVPTIPRPWKLCIGLTTGEKKLVMEWPWQWKVMLNLFSYSFYLLPVSLNFSFVSYCCVTKHMYNQFH